MPAVLVPITGSVLEWAMQEAGLTDRDVGAHLGVDPGRVRAWITGAEQPSKTLFDRLSRLLDRPESFFFLATPPPTVTTTARFRAPAGGRGHQPPSLEDLKAIRLAQNLQRVARWLAGRTDGAADLPRASIDEAPELVAEKLRDWLGWSTGDQINSQEHQVAKALRGRIEDRGIIALNLTLSQGGFRGFSLPDSDAPVLAINTRDDTRARTFSYIHECAHLLLGDEAICQIVPESRTERWCDAVAGAFLMPRVALAPYVEQQFAGGPVDSYEQVKRAANRFNVSLRAMAVRLEQLGLGMVGLYRLVDSVASAASRRGGGSGPPQTRARIRLQRYGQGYVGRLIDAERAGELERADLVDLLDLSRAELKELRAIVAEGPDG